MGSSFLLPRCGCLVRGPKEAKNPAGENVRRLIQIRSATLSFDKISPSRQAQSPQARLADSSSWKAVNFPSACRTKHFQSPRCMSAIQSALGIDG